MRYIETVDANIWDSSNEAQIDKIIDWLTINAPGQFSYEDDELRVQLDPPYTSPIKVKDGEAIIISRRGLELMNGGIFKSVYNLVTDEDE